MRDTRSSEMLPEYDFRGGVCGKYAEEYAREPPIRPHDGTLPGKDDATMPSFFRLQVDEDALTDALFAFVSDPLPSRNDRPVVQELHGVAPEMVDVLESMVIDGVDERHYVADYVRAVIHDRLIVGR